MCWVSNRIPWVKDHNPWCPKEPVPTPAPPPPTASCPNCDIEVVDEATGNVITGTIEKMAGQKIRLLVRSTVQGQNLRDIKWTIPDPKVKDYVATVGSTAKTPLGSGEYGYEHISFYWLDGSLSGDTKMVTVEAKVAGAQKTKTVTIKLFKPEVNSTQRKKGDPPGFVIALQAGRVTRGYDNQTSQSLTNFNPGPPPHEGSEWDAYVTAPTPSSTSAEGEIAFVQLINVNRTWTNNAGETRVRVSGRLVFDDYKPRRNVQVQPNSKDIQYGGDKATIANGEQKPLNSSDSPMVPLSAGDQAATASENFETYVMYKPAGADSIWVTLAMGTWEWAGQTKRIGAPASPANTWSPATGTNSPSRSVGGFSTKLPEWNGYFHGIPET